MCVVFFSIVVIRSSEKGIGSVLGSWSVVNLDIVIHQGKDIASHSSVNLLRVSVM